MRNRRGVLLCCLLLLLIVSSARGQAGSTSGGKVFLWQVRSEKGAAYLLGSIHFLKKDVYPLDARIEEAFARSGVLAVESDIRPRAKEKLAKFILENAFYPEGDTLENHVSRETYELVRRKLSALGAAQVDRMRPWALGLTAATIELMKMGFDPEYGIDRYFIEKADGRKEIVELEPYDYVFRLVQGLPDGIQDLFLFYTLADLENGEQEIGNIIAYWRTGNVRGMEEVVYRSRDEYPKLLPVYEILLSGRNRTMADKIEGMLRSGESWFIVVGAAHLVGKDGILERLREKGYEVEQR